MSCSALLRDDMRLATLFAALALAAPAAATEYWAVANTLSTHSQTECYACQDGKTNGFNWGGGIEARFSHQLSAQVGGYRNTYSHGTAYAIGIWQPITDGTASAGFFVGAATGYKSDPECHRNLCPVGGFLLTFADDRYGFNVMIVPAVSKNTTNVFGLQLKVRIH